MWWGKAVWFMVEEAEQGDSARKESEGPSRPHLQTTQTHPELCSSSLRADLNPVKFALTSTSTILICGCKGAGLLSVGDTVSTPSFTLDWLLSSTEPEKASRRRKEALLGIRCLHSSGS